MGMFDTMQQGMKSMGQAAPAMGAPIGGTPNAMGQGFAQQKSPNQLNKVGQAKPVMSAWRQGQRPNPTAGQVPGGMGSRNQIMQKQKMMQEASQPAVVRQESPARSYGSGLPTLQTPYEQQIQASKPNAVMGASQIGPAIGAMGQTMGQPMNEGMTQLYGSSGLQNAPFGGEQPGSNGFQSMMEQYSGQRPDVMNRGIGPSAQLFGGQSFNEMQPQQPVVMDENGLEPRRGAR